MDNTKMRVALDEVKGFGADFIGLQETKLNLVHREVTNRAQGRIQRMLKARTVITSNNGKYTESYWKPGGMATFLMGQLISKQNITWTDLTSIIQRTHIKNHDVKISITRPVAAQSLQRS